VTLAEVRDQLHAERNLQARAGNQERAAAMLDAALMLEADPQFKLPEAVEALAEQEETFAALPIEQIDEPIKPYRLAAQERARQTARRLRGLLGGGP
jgi:hypothetical protein